MRVKIYIVFPLELFLEDRFYGGRQSPVIRLTVCAHLKIFNLSREISTCRSENNIIAVKLQFIQLTRRFV